MNAILLGYQRCWFLGVLLVLLLSQPLNAKTKFTAYNDCVYSSDNQYLGANVTTYATAGYNGPDSGQLVDQTTGTITPVIVTLSQSGGVSIQSTSTYGGNDTDPGTDAYATFHGYADMTGVYVYGSDGWWVEIAFTNLNPLNTYTFATSANRNNSAANYAERWTRYSIMDADSFTNASTPGVQVNSEDSVSFSTGYNQVAGYVARWTNIQPGPDGAFRIRAASDTGHPREYSSSDNQAYSFDVFMLSEDEADGQPTVELGNDMSVVFNQEDPTVTLQLTATVSDDGKPWADPENPATSYGLQYQWSVVSSPNGSTVSFTPSETIAQPSVIFSAIGSYILRLSVSDGPETAGGTTVSDDMLINLLPELPYGCPTGSLNSDCTVDLLDLIPFVAQWLQPAGCLGNPGCADFFGNDGVNLIDFKAISRHWFQSGNAIVINEIHYNPDVKTELVEFVELYNPTDINIDISNYSFARGIDWQFPPDTIMEPDTYLVVARYPDSVRTKFNLTADQVFGPFTGKLDNTSDRLELVDPSGNRIDQVEYQLGFPWPTVGDTVAAASRSIQLISPLFDNDLGGSWRSAYPTPGAPNASVFAANIPPHIRQVNHEPRQPHDNESVIITAKVTDADGVDSVSLLYQDVAPGNYINIDDPDYQTDWTPLAMNDAGLNGDAQANDSIYSVQFPASLNSHRHLIRYRIQCRDTAGNQLTVPYADDPQPNFAWFVYNGIPDWNAAVDPANESGNPTLRQANTFTTDTLTSLPVYQLLTKHQDLLNAQYWPGTTTGAYTGSDYLWSGTLIYDGVVYDHIHYRARGGVWRYSMGKNMWKFAFNRGHYFQARDQYGKRYDTDWSKLNFSAVIQQGDYGSRGEQGLFESIGFNLFNLAGVEAPKTHWVQFRVIDADSETGATQYDSDFWGMYLAIEQEDGRFLDEHHLPDGNLYKMENWTGELNNQGPLAATDKSDLNAFLSYPTTEAQWRAELDLQRYYSYRSIVEGIHHYDIAAGKNYFYYLNPETNIWSVHPWDLDLTWADNMYGNGNEPFKSRVLSFPSLNLEYTNRLREIRDLLYNPDQMNHMLDEFAAMIDNPATPLSMVDADRAMWDYHPIMVASTVNSVKARKGLFYKAGTPTQDFAGMVQRMKNYVVSRSAWIDSTLLNDPGIPATPVINYNGEANYPVNALAFASSDFSNPAGYGSFGGIVWRIAEVSYPGTAGYDPEKRSAYEITPVWNSPVFTVLADGQTIRLPADPLKIGHTYRVRCRVKNTTGRWSHWSAPIEFTTADPLAVGVVSDFRLTELMAHPAPLTDSDLDEDEFEFLEFKNIGSNTLDLSHIQITDGITFDFANAAIQTLDAGEFVLIVRNQSAFELKYGTGLTSRIAGEYSGKLSNSGETVLVNDYWNGEIMEVTYGDGAGWPRSTDGAGHSMVPLDNAIHSANPVALCYGPNWRASAYLNGSPGSDDPALPPSLIINEIKAHTDYSDPTHPDYTSNDWIELYNTGATALNLNDWYLSDDPENLKRYSLAGRQIQPGQFLALDEIDDFNNPQGSGFGLNKLGEAVVLSCLPGTTEDRIVDIIVFKGQENLSANGQPISLGRYPDGAGWLFTLPAGSGQPNSQPLLRPQIREIMYNPGPNQDWEYIEIFNPTSNTMTLEGDGGPWRIAGQADLVLPASFTLPANGRVLLVGFDPSNTEDLAGFTSQYATGALVPGVDIIGPWSGSLSNKTGRIALEMPLHPEPDSGETPWVIIDEVLYFDAAPWPAAPDGQGQALHRISSDATLHGSNPANWTSQTPLQ